MLIILFNVFGLPVTLVGLLRQRLDKVQIMIMHNNDSRLEIENDTTEIKRNLRYGPADDTLSEWELSRQTSKTWSMEQD